MLFRALLISLVIHFFVLFGAHPVFPLVLPGADNGASALNARLDDRPVDKHIAQSNQATAVLPATKASESVSRRTIPKKVNSVPDFPQFSQSTAANDPPAKTESISPMGHPQDQTSALWRPADLSEAKSAEVKNIEAKNIEGLGEYRLGLAREARRFKRYPTLARENAWTGVVVLTIQGVASSATPTVLVDQSSGHAVLDAQALEMVEKATRLAPLPDSLMGKRFAISLPIHYRLDD